MKLIVGLGNPGARYAGNRHNIGFMAVDRIAEDHGFPPWRAKFQGLLSEGRLGSARAALLKPETYMNESGRSVGEAARFFKIEPGDVIVLHDELDLAPGRCKLKTGGGHAGHNGLRSIQSHLGPGFGRVRLGIGHPGHKDRVSGYVLHDFARADAEWLDELMRGISDGAGALASGDGPRFLNAVALRTSPPRSGTGEGRPKPGAGAGEAAALQPARTAGGARDGGRALRDAAGGREAAPGTARSGPPQGRPEPRSGPGPEAGSEGGPEAGRGSAGPEPGDEPGDERTATGAPAREDGTADRRSALRRLVDRFR